MSEIDTKLRCWIDSQAPVDLPLESGTRSHPNLFINRRFISQVPEEGRAERCMSVVPKQ